MICISLEYQNRIYYRELQSNGKVTFGCGKKDTVSVPQMSEGQISILEAGERLTIQTKAPFAAGQRSCGIGELISLDAASGTRLYASRVTGCTVKAALPFDGIVRIGRSAEKNDISIALPFVSGEHLQLTAHDGTIRVEDRGSTNGLYLNGMRIRAALMQSGDVLNILTARIRLVNNELCFDNTGSTVKVSDGYLKQNTPAGDRNRAHGKYLDYRLSPRIQSSLPQEPIILDRPPRKGQEYHPSGSRIASMLSMGAMAGASLAMGMTSPALAFSRVISMAAGVYNMAANKKAEDQRIAQMREYNRRLEEEYKTYIEAQRARILCVAEEQRRILREENPAPAHCLQMVDKLDARLWERMSTDRDFLDVRLGMGYEDLCVPIKNYAENRGLVMEDGELEDLCNAIAEENRVVDFIPARVRLRSTPTLGIVGNRNVVAHQMRNMLLSLTALHSGSDVKIMGIFDAEERGRWAALRWLPHIWEENGQRRYLAFDQERAHELCDILNDVLKRRLAAASDGYDTKKQPPIPHYVVILGSRTLAEREPVMQLLTSNNPKLGVSTIFLFDELYNLPQECETIIDLNMEHPSIYSKRCINRRAVFSRDPSVSREDFSNYARRMAAIRLEESRVVHSLPSSISFLEGLGVRTIEELNVLRRWQRNVVTSSLAAPIGVLPNGDPFCLDVHYKAHGAHGLLAGTTGSGKSELLRTWILSMAVNYHPHLVNFVIIDYKGGGMANKLESLPHVVGKITNIGSNIYRSLVSLKQEAKRRMAILEAHPGVDDIDQYLNLYYAGKVTQPMPHMIIVSDEFAELKKEEPEFLKELSSIARVGRSVGIHLLLATQQPAGIVDDQIDSNSRFRICMKVNSVQDSKEIIRHPDAASIIQRGRAYVRIGEDEMFELFQSYWSGAEYRPGDTASGCTSQVSIVDISGERIQYSAAKKGAAIGTDQLSCIVSHICEQAQMARIAPLPGPWQPELPQTLALEQLDAPIAYSKGVWQKHNRWLQVPVGMFDRPDRQIQGVQCLDFAATPHYGIYGGPGSGKTVLLKTLILSLGLTHSPKDVNLYILDFGSRSLTSFASMPHVCDVILDNEEEKLQDFMQNIRTEIRRRMLQFQKEKLSNYEAYRRSTRDPSLPAIFVIVDNQLRLSGNIPDTDQFLVDLSISGTDAGVHLVFTSNNINKTSNNLRNNVGGSVALQMTDTNDYRMVVGIRPEGSGMPNRPGHGLIRDTDCAEFQTAMFRPVDTEPQRNAALEKLLQEMAKASPQKSAAPKGMPAKITVEDLSVHYRTRDLLPLGLKYADRKPYFMDLHTKHSMLISAEQGQEAVSAITAVAKLLKTNPDNQLYILDGSGALAGLKQECSKYGSSNPSYPMDAVVDTLFRALNSREDALFDLQEGTTETVFSQKYPQLCILLYSMHQVMGLLTEENRQRLLRICGSTEKLGMICIGCGTVEELGTYSILDPLTNLLTDSGSFDSSDNWQKGMCLGGTVRSHDYFTQKMLSAEEKSLKLESQDAMVFDCGTAVRIKRIG